MAQQVNLAELFDAYKREDEVVVLPAGQYTLEVLRANVRQGNKGPGIMPVYKVLDGPYAGKTVMAGQFTASEAGRSIFFRQMAGFGLGEEFFRMGASIEDAARALVGRVVQAAITVRPYQGQDRNNIAIGGISLVSAAPDPVAGQVAAPTPAAPPVTPVAPSPATAPAQPAVAQPVPAAAPTAAPVPTAAVPPMPPIPAASGSPF